MEVKHGKLTTETAESFKGLRRILQIRWPYVVSNRDILAKTKLKTISTEVKLRRWKWVGHILRMDKNSKCETALTWTPEGRRKVGDQLLKMKHTYWVGTAGKRSDM